MNLDSKKYIYTITGIVILISGLVAGGYWVTYQTKTEVIQVNDTEADKAITEIEQPTKTVEERLVQPSLPLERLEGIELPDIPELTSISGVSIPSVKSWLVSPSQLDNLSFQTAIDNELQELLDYEPINFDEDATLEFTPGNGIQESQLANLASPLPVTVYADIQQASGISQYEIDRMFNE